MIRKLLVPLLLLCLAAASCSSLAAAAATVNGQKIAETVVETELGVLRNDPVFGDAVRRDPDTRGVRRRQILTELIYEAVAQQEANRRGIRPTRSQADSLIQQEATNRNMTVAQFLKSQKLTEAQARNIADRIVRVFALQERLAPAVTIDDKTVRAEYEARKDSFAEIHLERITVKTAVDAQAIEKKLAGGADFAALAKQSSTDGLAPLGGDTGFVPVGALPAEVKAATDALVVGGVSDAVPASGGFQIFRLVDRRTKTLDEVAADIRNGLEQAQRQQYYDTWLAARVRAAHVIVNPQYGRFQASGQHPQVVAASAGLQP